jgi:hypothetical protein
MLKRLIFIFCATVFFAFSNLVSWTDAALATSISQSLLQDDLNAIVVENPTARFTTNVDVAMGRNDVGAIADQRRMVATHSLLTQLADYSRQLYSLAHLNQWQEAKQQVQPMSQLIEKLSYQELPSAELTQLQSYLLDLQGAVAANSHQTLLDANQLAFLATSKAVQMDQSMPMEVVNLDYYTHALDPWVKMGNLEQLKNISQQIRQNWESLRPALNHQHQSEHLKNYYDGLISLLEKAETPHEYTLVTPPLLAEMGQLQTVLSL